MNTFPAEIVNPKTKLSTNFMREIVKPGRNANLRFYPPLLP
jgi:hypothetical protein